MGVHSNSPRLKVGSTAITHKTTPVGGAQNLTRSSSWLSDAITIAGSGEVLVSRTYVSLALAFCMTEYSSHASAPGELPRGEGQIINTKQKTVFKV